MNANETALILIGFQNDYFAKDGILSSVIEESAQTNQVLENTLRLLHKLVDSEVTLIETPIGFPDNYGETNRPVGLLKAITELGAFRDGSPGSETLPELKAFGDRILTSLGKDGFNAFNNTGLEPMLQERGIRNLAFAGAVTSICIDSTGRSAHERGYNVSVLSDCTCGRTNFEQDFYCEQILPLYSEVIGSEAWLSSIS